MNELNLVPLHANPRNPEKLSFEGRTAMLPDSSSQIDLIFDKLVWTVSDVAKELHCSSRTVHRLVAEDKIPYAKVGRLVRFSRIRIHDWLKKGGSR
jgi:excisionase family DNA binding protein